MKIVDFKTMGEFKKGGLYEFKAIATTEHKDNAGENFDVDSLRFSCSNPPLYIEHNHELPVGNVTSIEKKTIQNMPLVMIAGQIDGAIFPKVVDRVKNGFYKGVSIHGFADSVVDKKYMGGLVGEVSLTAIPCNPHARIFKKSLNALGIENGFDFEIFSDVQNNLEGITNIPKRKLTKADLSVLTMENLQSWLQNFASAEVAKLLIKLIRAGSLKK